MKHILFTLCMLLMIVTAQAQETRPITGRVNDLPFNSSFYNLGSSTNRQLGISAFSQFSIISYMARLNYAYKGKYYATLVTRWMVPPNWPMDTNGLPSRQPPWPGRFLTKISSNQ